MRSNADRVHAVLDVRRGVWLLLAAALLLSLLLPLARLWSTATAPLDVTASVSPSTPRLGQTVRLIVEVRQASDQAAMHGPWAHLVATWDMTAMPMGNRSAALAGPAPTAPDVSQFVVPLILDMTGQWAATISLTAPGRPTWKDSLQFTLLPASTAAVTSERSSS